jgi:urease accessory protein
MATEHSHSHAHEGLSHAHSGGGDHGHTHEQYNGPGSYMGREPPIIQGRDWNERAFTIGIGG